MVIALSQRGKWKHFSVTNHEVAGNVDGGAGVGVGTAADGIRLKAIVAHPPAASQLYPRRLPQPGKSSC